MTEWYHQSGVDIPLGLKSEYQSRVGIQTQAILQLLGSFQVKATFFILGVIAEKYPDLVKRIDSAGHEIASYGYRYRRVFNHTTYSFREDVHKSLEVLRRIIGRPVTMYRAPEFSITRQSFWAVDILQHSGVSCDSSIFPFQEAGRQVPASLRVRHQLREGLVEFPPSAVRFLGMSIPFAGGFFLRALPYFMIKTAVGNMNRKNIPVNTFFNIWEFDEELPQLPMPFKGRFLNYFAIKQGRVKLLKLLGDFEYAPIGQILKEEDIDGIYI